MILRLLIVLLVGCELPDSNNAAVPGGTQNRLVGDCPIFPADNPWNQDISSLPVHPNSAAFLSSIGERDLHPDFGAPYQGTPLGIPFVVVDQNQPTVPVSFDYESESDPGPYPIPSDMQVESGADAHAIIVEKDSCTLYELFMAERLDDGNRWSAAVGARFDLQSNELRPDRWTSADAAGLPILPGLALYDEVMTDGEIKHALRMTVRRSQNGYIHPARHSAGSDNPDDPPMGLRLRMKSDFDCSQWNQVTQVFCEAFKTYGVMVSDNGSSWYISGAPDDRWDNNVLNDLKDVPSTAFEAVDTGPITPW